MDHRFNLAIFSIWGFRLFINVVSLVWIQCAYHSDFHMILQERRAQKESWNRRIAIVYNCLPKVGTFLLNTLFQRLSLCICRLMKKEKSSSEPIMFYRVARSLWYFIMIWHEAGVTRNQRLISIKAPVAPFFELSSQHGEPHISAPTPLLRNVTTTSPRMSFE